MKKHLILVLAGLLVLLPAKAVLNEKNLSQSLGVLRVELSQAYDEQIQQLQRWKASSLAQHQQMIEILQQSSQVSLMLYSQKSDYVFDQSYACSKAIEQYHRFKRQRAPYDKITRWLNTEVDRYNGLIETLKRLPPAMRRQGNRQRPRPQADSTGVVWLKVHRPDSALINPYVLDEQGQEDRAKCILYAAALRDNLIALYAETMRDSASYSFLDSHLAELNNYARQRYHDIQQSIFVNQGTPYWRILTRLPLYVKYMRQDVHDKYSSGKEFRGTKSDWRGPVVLGYVGFVLVALSGALMLSIVLVNLLHAWLRRRKLGKASKSLADAPKFLRNFDKMKICLIFALGTVVFAAGINLVKLFLTHNFFLMATGLLVEYAWLLVVIFVSLLIRLDGEQVKSGFRIYTPIMLMGFIIIVFRIVFIPNMLVNLLFPPVVLLFTWWQWRTVKLRHKDVPRTDMFYTWTSLAVMTVSTVAAWVGYTLLAVEIFIWWLFQLTAIQTITCAYVLLDTYEERVLRRRIGERAAGRLLHASARQAGEHITVTWLFDFVKMAVIPVAAVYSVLYSIYLAADVFDLSDTCLTIFLYPFLDIEGVIKLSLFLLVVVSGLFFIFRYLCYAAKAFYRHFRLQRAMSKSGKRLVRTNEVNLTLGYNIIVILVWGIYAVTAIVLLRIPKSGISIVTAGLATGLGFAMKDLLNNFFYGVSLMAGRLRVGDWIECDGVQGKVESITYQSTQIITTDDCVMAFLNSSLFAKNFKNLTRNHSYELVKIPVGVAYGTDVDQVRRYLKEDLRPLQVKDRYGREVVEPKTGVVVVLSAFGDSSVDLTVVMRVLVSEKVGFLGKAKEAIYNSLNRHHVEIPFPQRDLHIHNAAPAPAAAPRRRDKQPRQPQKPAPEAPGNEPS